MKRPQSLLRLGPVVWTWMLTWYLMGGATLHAQTLVAGTVSGVWAAKNSPYILIDNCTVPGGESLTIEPGVTVIVGEALRLTVNGGSIVAEGTPSKRITFRSPNGQVTWDRIALTMRGPASRFRYCDFSRAQWAITASAVGVDAGLLEIEDCKFVDMSDGAIYCGAFGTHETRNDIRSAKLGLNLRRCRVAHRILIQTQGQRYSSSTGSASGSVAAEIEGNLFVGTRGTPVIETQPAAYGGLSPIHVVNNVFRDCQYVLRVVDYFDAVFNNNIITGADVAVQRTGSLSSQVSYNCLFGNRTNFVGYPKALGSVVFDNRNGTPTDVAFNIFADPRFANTNDFRLAPDSPCIDAGAPGDASKDACLPGFGTDWNDMGAYGGPSSCGWYSNEPPVLLGIGAKEIDEESLLAFGVTVTDPDVPAQTLKYALLDPPAGAQIDPALGILTWVPTEAQGPGDYTITLEVRDNARPTNGVTLGSFTVKVKEKNAPPRIDPVGDVVLEAGVPLRLPIPALDPDLPVKQQVTFSLDDGAPAGASIDPAIGLFSWTPTAEQARTPHAIRVRATDNGAPPLSTTITFNAGPAGAGARVALERSASGAGLRLVLDQGAAGAGYEILTATALGMTSSATDWSVWRTVRPDRYPFTTELGEPSPTGARFYRVGRVP